MGKPTATNAGPKDPQRRTGGRSARVRSAVLDATFEALLEVGLGKISIADIAKRAKVHQTSIYRRWGTLENLMVDALLSGIGQEAPIPDTGSLEGDLHAFVGESAALMESTQGRALAKFAVTMADSPELAEVRRDYWSRALTNAGKMFERAVLRGEVAPETDPAIAVEAVAGPLYMRLLVTGEPLDPEFLNSVVDTVLRGLKR